MYTYTEKNGHKKVSKNMIKNICFLKNVPFNLVWVNLESKNKFVFSDGSFVSRIE